MPRGIYNRKNSKKKAKLPRVPTYAEDVARIEAQEERNLVTNELNLVRKANKQLRTDIESYRNKSELQLFAMQTFRDIINLNQTIALQLIAMMQEEKLRA